MFTDLTQLSTDRYDVLIAGSGFAAVSVARRAAERGLTVLMIETGAAEYDDVLQTEFAEIRGRGHYDGAHWPLHWVRSLGGTSSVWAGYCAALTDRNLADWPISRSDLASHFQQAAAELGRGEPFLTFSTPALPGFTYRPMSLGDPLRLAPDRPEIFETTSGIDTLLNVSVSRLHPRSDRRGLTGLTLSRPGTPDREVTLRDGQSVVLAAGGIGNAQILLSSDAADARAVGNEADQVGRYLMEHPHFYGCARIVAPPSFTIPALPEGFGDYIDVLEPDDALHAEIGGLDISMELEPGRMNDADQTEQFLLGRIGEAAQIYDITVRCEMPADPENRVTVRAGRDPAGLRRVETSCIIGAEGLRAVDAALVRLGQSLAAEGDGRLRIANDVFFHARPEGGGHTMGTTRMGADTADSVVDRDCRVHGYANLFVAGSSVFRTGGYANPTLNLMALANRLGAQLGDGA